MNIEEKALLCLAEDYIKRTETSRGYWDKINHQRLIELLDRHGLLSACYHQIKRYLNIEAKKEASFLYKKAVIFNNLLLNELIRIKRHFDREKINFVLLKGFSTGALLYESIFDRTQGDIDILINANDIERVRDEFDYLGYCMVKNYKLIPGRKHDFSYGFHECGYGKAVGDGKYLNIELHRNTEGIPINYISEFIKNTINVSINNEIFEIFDIYHYFINMCTNAYVNFETYHGVKNCCQLRDIMEIAMFWRKHEMNTLELMNLANKFGMEHKVYAMIYYAKKIFPTCFPINVFPLNSNKEHQTFYKNGFFLNWNENSIYDRLFGDSKTKISEYKSLYFLKCYSEKNINYMNKSLVGVENSCFDIFRDNSYNEEIKYKISYEDNIICFTFLLSDMLYDRLIANHQLIIAFPTTDENTEDLMNSICIGNYKGDLLAQIDKKLLPVVYTQININSNMISINVPTIFLELNHGSELCYNIFLREFICGDIFEWRGARFGCGEYTNDQLGFLKFE